MRAIDEQRERYVIQAEIEKEHARQERGKQRLIDMAAGKDPADKPPLRGLRLWLARLFGLV